MSDVGKKLYIKAKKMIPGGNQLLSKRPEMFLPNQWPAYYKKSKGIKTWDLNNKCYEDFSIMRKFKLNAIKTILIKNLSKIHQFFI